LRQVKLLNHGGRLNRAAQEFNIPVDDWIDLSTGINPDHWPIPAIPEDCFTRLPETDDGLIDAAQQYYQADNFLPVAGSQSAIQLLPKLRSKSTVAVPETGYAEHAYHWQLAGHDIIFYNTADIDKIISDVDVLIIINPNNPTGESYTQKTLLKWHKELQSHHGWLIVDEAFIDCDTTDSLVAHSQQSGLIVLRSIGKFFGLAGIRSGFIFADNMLLETINEKLGQWTLAGASRYLTKAALLDTGWQQQTITELKQSSTKISDLISTYSGCQPTGCYLFKTISHSDAEQLYALFASNGILVRLLDNKQGVRFGLPKKDQWQTVNDIFKKAFHQLHETKSEQAKKTA